LSSEDKAPELAKQTTPEHLRRHDWAKALQACSELQLTIRDHSHLLLLHADNLLGNPHADSRQSLHETSGFAISSALHPSARLQLTLEARLARSGEARWRY
jgi:hypothetical protein